MRNLAVVVAVILVSLNVLGATKQCRGIFVSTKAHNFPRIAQEPRLSSEQIISVIKYLVSEGIRPTVSAMARGDRYHPSLSSKMIRKNTGIRGSSQSVFIDATKRHGKSWEWWLEAAGMDAALVNASSPRLREQDILKVVEYLMIKEVRLDEKYLLADHQGHYVISPEAIAEATGIRVSTARVYVDATNGYSRSWESWIDQVKQRQQTQRVKEALSGEEIIRVIQYLESRFVELSDTKILKVEISALDIYRSTGVRTTIEKLYRDATSYFQKDWNYWLESAGINSYYISKQHTRLARADIIRVISFLKSQKIPMSEDNMTHLQTRYNIDAQKIYEATGIKVEGQKVLQDATKGYGQSWHWWLQHAGF